MAFYGLEPWGSHYDDLRAGTIASMLANIHRNEKVRREPFGPLEFMAWNEEHRAAVPDPGQASGILLDDPDAQSNLIISVMFPGKAP